MSSTQNWPETRGVLGSPVPKRQRYPGLSPVRHHKGDQGLQHLTSVERLKAGTRFSLEKRRFQSNFINMYKYSVGGNEEDGGRPFSVMSTERRRGNTHKTEALAILCKYKEFASK